MGELPARQKLRSDSSLVTVAPPPVRTVSTEPEQDEASSSLTRTSEIIKKLHMCVRSEQIIADHPLKCRVAE